MLFPRSIRIVFISEFYFVMRLMPFTFRFQPPRGNTKHTSTFCIFFVFILVGVASFDSYTIFCVFHRLCVSYWDVYKLTLQIQCTPSLPPSLTLTISYKYNRYTFPPRSGSRANTCTKRMCAYFSWYSARCFGSLTLVCSFYRRFLLMFC